MRGRVSQNLVCGTHIPYRRPTITSVIRPCSCIVKSQSYAEMAYLLYSNCLFRLAVILIVRVLSRHQGCLGGWSDPHMVPDFRRDAVNSAREMNNDPRHPLEASQAKARLRTILLLDSLAWEATRRAPFQFVRWISALAAVVVNWVQSGSTQSAAAYVPVLAVVALLLLPDAQSIEIPGLKFDRLTNEIARQRRSVDRLSAEVSLVNHSLIAGSQVNITMGATAADAARVATVVQSVHSPQQPREPIAPGSQQNASVLP